MLRLTPLFLIAAGVCPGGQSPHVGESPPMPEIVTRVDVPEARLVDVALGLEVVSAIDFAPDGRVFIAERPGRVRVVRSDGALDPKPWAELDVWARSEAGLVAMTLHPEFPDSPFVYVMYTRRGVAGVEARVTRIVEVDGRGGAGSVIVGGIPAAALHSGGELGFGPDGFLYIGTGDATRPERAQDLGSLGGKILRVDSDGMIPADNPIRGSAVYALGLRNVQGFDWDPITGDLYATMHGPTGEWGFLGRDEVNVIRPGGNYGWPRFLGAPGAEGFVDPLLEYRRAVAPSGAAFYDGPIEEWRGDLFFGALIGEHLHRVVFDDRRAVVRVERLWQGSLGRVRAVRRGPDGHLYIGTSNRDGRGHTRAGDDRLLRIVPARSNQRP